MPNVDETLSRLLTEVSEISLDEYAEEQAWTYIETAGYVPTPMLIFALKQYYIDAYDLLVQSGEQC